jgi:hypothetical protein
MANLILNPQSRLRITLSAEAFIKRSIFPGVEIHDIRGQPDGIAGESLFGFYLNPCEAAFVSTLQGETGT